MQSFQQPGTQFVPGHPTQAALGPVEIESIYLHQVNWSILRTGFPFFNRLRLSNMSNVPCRVFLKFEVTAQHQIVAQGETVAEIPPNGKMDLEKTGLNLNYDLSFAYGDTADGSLKVIAQLNAGDWNFRRELSFPLQVLSGKEWCAGITRRDKKIDFYKEFPYHRVKCLITPDNKIPKPEPVWRRLSPDDSHRLVTSAAALVFPNHPAIKKLLLQMDQNIAAVTTNRDEYNVVNLLSTPEGRRLLTKQIYTKLFHSDIYYSIEEVSFESLTQRIRLPEEILNGPAAATCIDLALVFCAALSNVGLRPLLLLLETSQQQVHAIVGIWTIDPPNDLEALSDGWGLIDLDFLVRNLDGLLLFDPTGSARKLKFQQAVDEAKELLKATVNEGRFGFALDLQTTWKSVTPLPWFADPILRVSGFEHHYLSQLKERVIRELSIEVGSSAELISPQSIYIPLKGQRLNNPETAEVDILNHVANLIRDRVCRISVLGNAGSGKSYFMGKLTLELAERYHGAPEDTPIPVLFPLKRFENQPNRGLLLQLQEFLQSFGYPIIPAEEFGEKVRQGKFIFLLDGLDELPVMPGSREEEEYLKPLSPLLEIPGVVVIITARSGLFAARAAALLSGFELLELSKWDKSNWEELLNKCVAHNVISPAERSNLSDLIDNAVARIKELITKPLYCRMLIETRGLVSAGTLVNEAQLFQLYADRFIQRRLGSNDRLAPPQKIQCMQKTAFYMEEKGRRVLAVLEIAELLTTKYPAWLSHDDWHRYMSAIKVYGFLDNSLKDLFYFSHEAFREFFLASKFFQELFSVLELPHSKTHAANPDACKAWIECGALSLSFAVLKFVAQLLELQPQEERMNKDEQVLRWIEQERPDGSLWHGSSLPENLLRSLVTLRVLSGQDCMRLDLSDLDFSRLDLSGANFSGSDLSGSSFVNSNLEGCVFHAATLTSADMSHSRLDGVDFREAELMGAKFLQCSLPGGRVKFFGAKNLHTLVVGPEQRQQLVACLNAEREAATHSQLPNIAWFNEVIDKIGCPS